MWEQFATAQRSSYSVFSGAQQVTHRQLLLGPSWRTPHSHWYQLSWKLTRAISARQIKQGEQWITVGSRVQGRTEVYFTQTHVGALANLRTWGICSLLKENAIRLLIPFFPRRVNLSSRIRTGKSVEPARGHKSQLDGRSCTHLTAQCIYIWIDDDVMNHEGYKSRWQYS